MATLNVVPNLANLTFFFTCFILFLTIMSLITHSCSNEYLPCWFVLFQTMINLSGHFVSNANPPCGSFIPDNYQAYGSHFITLKMSLVAHFDIYIYIYIDPPCGSLLFEENYFALTDKLGDVITVHLPPANNYNLVHNQY